MKTTFKKTACAVLASAVFFAMTGCSQTEETEKTEKTEKETEETTEEMTEETEAVDTDEILETVEVYCDAVENADAETMVDMSSEELVDADMFIDYLDFDGCTEYSSDMGLILSTVADTITYEIDEDSLEVDEDGQTAEVTVTFTELDFYSESDEDFATAEDFLSYVENGDTRDNDIVITLELTDDGWKISNTEEVVNTVYEFMIMASLAPDFEFGADTTSGAEPSVAVVGDEPVLTYIDRDWYEEVGTYPDVDYDPSYIARLTYADYEIDFSGFSGSGISDWDFDLHTGNVEAGDSFDITISYSCDADDPDLEGFTFVVDHDGDVTIEDAEDLAIAVDVDASATGSYTITLADPWGRTVWEGYIEVV